MKFEKPALSVAEHIALLKSRGLSFGDETEAARCLQKCGYFRLKGYGLSFRLRDADGRLTEDFLPETTFESLVTLYEFDRHLRLLLLDAVERVEVAFRTQMNDTLAATYGPHWFTRAELFGTKLNEKDGTPLFDHAAFLEAARERKPSPFIRKYFATYTEPEYPPCWMLAETLTLGLWSRAYGMLVLNRDQKPVSDAFRVSVKEMTSWIQAITDLRNKCAHHARVWDSRFASAPARKGNLKMVITDNQTLFAQVAALLYCLWAIDPQSRWLDRLEALLQEYPLVPLLPMGFPPDWKDKLLSFKPSASGAQ